MFPSESEFGGIVYNNPRPKTSGHYLGIEEGNREQKSSMLHCFRRFDDFFSIAKFFSQDYLVNIIGIKIKIARRSGVECILKRPNSFCSEVTKQHFWNKLFCRKRIPFVPSAPFQTFELSLRP